MKPKEKALELRNKFRIFVGVGKDAEGDPVNNFLVAKHVAKRSALIAVNEILSDLGFIIPIEAFDFWQEVKTEIEKL